jgi:CheY-like chemotaxis protein
LFEYKTIETENHSYVNGMLTVNKMESSKRQKKLLIIDDDETSRILVKDFLGDFGLTVLEADCAVKAINIFNIHYNDIALVLIDMHFPGYEGSEILKQLKCISPAVKTIAISALNQSDLEAKSKGAGFNGCLSKPFDFDNLLSLINEYL